jgi:uncharacterized membrane protein YdjX (TVP38/TMEM64 family)
MIFLTLRVRKRLRYQRKRLRKDIFEHKKAKSHFREALRENGFWLLTFCMLLSATSAVPQNSL